MNGLTEQLDQLLLNVATGVISLVGAYAMLYINRAISQAKAETEQIRNEEQRALVQTALNRLEKVTAITVDAIEQTSAKALRQAVKDGSAGEDQLKALAHKAAAQVVTILEPEYVAVLNSTLGDLDTYLENLIEANVLAIKEGS